MFVYFLPSLFTVYHAVKIQNELYHLDSQRSYHPLAAKRLFKRIWGQLVNTVQCSVLQIINSEGEKYPWWLEWIRDGFMKEEESVILETK